MISDKRVVEALKAKMKELEKENGTLKVDLQAMTKPFPVEAFTADMNMYHLLPVI